MSKKKATPILIAIVLGLAISYATFLLPSKDRSLHPATICQDLREHHLKEAKKGWPISYAKLVHEVPDNGCFPREVHMSYSKLLEDWLIFTVVILAVELVIVKAGRIDV